MRTCPLTNLGGSAGAGSTLANTPPTWRHGTPTGCRSTLRRAVNTNGTGARPVVCVAYNDTNRVTPNRSNWVAISSASIPQITLYFAAISQVMAPRWSHGRAALVGDATDCPSPVSGMGIDTSEARAGATYEKRGRPYITQAQKRPPGIPWIAHPKPSHRRCLQSGQSPTRQSA